MRLFNGIFTVPYLLQPFDQWLLLGMVLLFGYDEEGCKAAGNIQPEQALTEQFPVFAHCLVLRLHRFQLRRTVIQLSGNPDKRGYKGVEPVNI